MAMRTPMSNIEQKDVLLKILIEFSDFCEKNNLSYFLDAGTLIGAIRHKGFIPWDDDIDVCMPREDYNRFLQILSKQNNKLTTYLYLQKPEDTMYPFAKVADNRTILIEHPEHHPEEVCVYIDIFPKDALKNKGVKTWWLCKINQSCELLQWFSNYSVYKWKKDKNYLKRCIALIGRKTIRNPNRSVAIQKHILKAHNTAIASEECEYVTTLVRGEYNKIAPSSCFESFIIQEFEGELFRVPIGYDIYLRCLYKGDYMELPPVDDRKGHNIILYWRDNEARKSFYEDISR